MNPTPSTGGEGPFVCPKCKRRFDSGSRVIEHMGEDHGLCSLCSEPAHVMLGGVWFCEKCDNERLERMLNGGNAPDPNKVRFVVVPSPAPISEGTPAAGPWCYDMEKAPKDGTMLLLFDSMSYAAACWENEAWDFGMAGECDLEGYVAWSPIFAPKEGRP